MHVHAGVHTEARTQALSHACAHNHICVICVRAHAHTPSGNIAALRKQTCWARSPRTPTPSSPPSCLLPTLIYRPQDGSLRSVKKPRLPRFPHGSHVLARKVQGWVRCFPSAARAPCSQPPAKPGPGCPFGGRQRGEGGRVAPVRCRVNLARPGSRVGFPRARRTWAGSLRRQGGGLGDGSVRGSVSNTPGTPSVSARAGLWARRWTGQCGPDLGGRSICRGPLVAFPCRAAAPGSALPAPARSLNWGHPQGRL